MDKRLTHDIAGPIRAQAPIRAGVWRCGVRRRRRVDLRAVILCLCAAMMSLGVARAGEVPPKIVQRVKASVVGIGNYQPLRSPPAHVSGTGFVVGDGRYVLTNAHVVVGATPGAREGTLAVFVSAGPGGMRLAVQVADDPEHDLAVLRISDRPLVPLELADSDRVQEGELYAFTGFPLGAVLGLHPVTHRGIVSAITPIVIPAPNAKRLEPRLIERLRAPYDVFQLDATAYPGNSGSPLYNPATGAVVGVISMVFVKDTKENLLKDPSGITYAMPIKYARALLKRAEQAP